MLGAPKLTCPAPHLLHQVAFTRVDAEVRQVAAAWGFEASAVDTVLRSERLLGTGGKVNVCTSGRRF